MKNLLFILLLFAIASCQDNEGMTNSQTDCLQDSEILEAVVNLCAFNHQSFPEDCKVFDLGNLALSSPSKDFFSDYCMELNDEIFFSNTAGVRINAIVEEKDHREEADAEYFDYDTPDCEVYCLRTEEADLKIASEKFSIQLTLTTRIGEGSDSISIAENLLTSLDVRSYFRRDSRSLSSRRKYWIDLENRQGQSLYPDTSILNFHSEKVLNGQTFYELLSNEDYNDSSWDMYDEVIYFNYDQGLVAVVDSLGELWLREF
ncbi:MAG: hypothetical protein HKN09_06845 [Saprospiraceae bacterium]|nr:hypothetical protein [Saprospiraceae bacterium]